jgi:hypothetical protein
VAAQEFVCLGLGYTEEAAVLGVIGEVHLVVDAGPVNPVVGLDAFVTGTRGAVMIVVDEVLVSDVNDRWAFGPDLGDGS